MQKKIGNFFSEDADTVGISTSFTAQVTCSKETKEMRCGSMLDLLQALSTRSADGFFSGMSTVFASATLGLYAYVYS